MHPRSLHINKVYHDSHDLRHAFIKFAGRKKVEGKTYYAFYPIRVPEDGKRIFLVNVTYVEKYLSKDGVPALMSSFYDGIQGGRR